MKNKFWLSGLGRAFCAPIMAFEAEGAGGGGDAGGGDAGAGAGDAAGDAGGLLGAALAGAAAGEGQEVKKEGEGQAAGEGEGGEAEAFAAEIPEGMDAYSGEFEAYNGAVNAFLAENPTASAADALKWAAGYQAQLVADQARGMADGFNEREANWSKDTLADPDLGGANMPKTNERMVRAIQTYDKDAAFARVLNSTGLGSHPDVVRFLAKVGETAQESDIMPPTAGGEQKRSFANRLYGKGK